MPGRRSLAAALVTCLALPRAASAQAPPVPVFGAATEVVAVPVFVTDKGGLSVAGLTAADFEIEDGGKHTEVVVFQAVDAGAASGEAESSGSPAVEAATRRQFLLAFDLGFSTPGGINRARAAAMDFLDRGLAPRDLAAVATIGPTGPSLLVGFTSDKGQLVRAVSGLVFTGAERLRDPLGLAWDLNLSVQETPTGLDFSNVGEDWRDLFYLQQRMEHDLYRRRVAGYLDGMEVLARLLDSVRGRKQVVLFSAGFDQSVVGGVQGTERQESARAVTEGRLWEVQGDSYFGDAATRDNLGGLFRRLGASDTVLHTVDIGGIAAGAEVAEATRTQIGRGRDTLAQLAANSGGMFLKEVNNVAAALAEVTRASRYFYVLGFAPVPDAKPGSFRKLSVKAKRAGLMVSHRPGYLTPDPRASPDATGVRLSAADAITKGLSGGAFALRALVVPVAGTDEARLLPVALEVDGADLLAGVKDKTLGLEVYGYVLDASGRIHDALSTAPALDVEKLGPSLRARGLQVLTVFRAPDGAADLRFWVRHRESGRASSLRVLARVETASWSMSMPLAMGDPASRVVVPVASRAHPVLDLPFRVGQRPFTPEVEPLLTNGGTTELCVMARPPETSLEVLVDLLGGDGTTVPLETSGPVRLVKDSDGAFRVVLRVAPRGVPAGAYVLRVTLRDQKGEEAFSETQVSLR